MEANGWRLFQYPLFENQLNKLTEAVEQLSISQPDTYKEHPKTKLLATIHRNVMEIIPRNPNAPEFRQGDTLGPDNRHWFRAKFHQRYRLFFRFSAKDKVIVYVWVNDEFTLLKAGSKTDAYEVFKSMLNAGDPPRTLETLLKHVKEMRGGGEKKLSFPRQEGFSEFLARSVYAWETTDPRGVRSSFPKYNQTLCCAPLIVEQQHFTKPDRRARFPAAME